MAYRSNITLNDGAASPAAHVFVPNAGQTRDGFIEFFDGSGNGISAGRWGIRARSTLADLQGTLAGKTNRVNVIEQMIYLPALTTVGTNQSGYQATPKVAYYGFVQTRFVLHELMTMQERKHLRVLNQNFLGHAAMSAAVDNLDVIS